MSSVRLNIPLNHILEMSVSIHLATKLTTKGKTQAKPKTELYDSGLYL